MTTSQSARTRAPSHNGQFYGQLYAPPAENLGALRDQQAQFQKVRRKYDAENAWLAGATLAPGFVVAGLEIAAGAPLISGKIGDLLLTEGFPPLRGDFWATRAGQRAHAELRAKVRAKDDWLSEPKVEAKSGGYVRPDVVAPVRSYQEGKPFQMELKPRTPSGRKAGLKAEKRYRQETGRKTRTIYYNVRDYRD